MTTPFPKSAHVDIDRDSSLKDNFFRMKQNQHLSKIRLHNIYFWENFGTIG